MRGRGTHARRLLGLVDLLAEGRSRLVGLALEVRLLDLLLAGGDEAASDEGGEGGGVSFEALGGEGVSETERDWDAPLDLLERTGGKVASLGDVALGRTRLGALLRIAGGVLRLGGAGREDAASEGAGSARAGGHRAHRRELDALGGGVEDVGREVASLADELAERVLRVGAVRVVGGVLARLGAGVLAKADEALGVVERRTREVRGLVREGLVADRAARGVADLVTDGLVAGHGVRVVVAVVGVAMEGGGGRREKGGEGGGRGRKGDP